MERFDRRRFLHCLIELNQAIASLDKESCGRPAILSGERFFQPLVALHEQRFGFGILLLFKQRSTKPALGFKRRADFGFRLLAANVQILEQQGELADTEKDEHRNDVEDHPDETATP